MVVMKADGENNSRNPWSMSRSGWCHEALGVTTPQTPLFARNVSRLHTTYQTYNYHLQIKLTFALGFLINYLMRWSNGHKESFSKTECSCSCRGSGTIKYGLNICRTVQWVNVSWFSTNLVSWFSGENIISCQQTSGCVASCYLSDAQMWGVCSGMPRLFSLLKLKQRGQGTGVIRNSIKWTVWLWMQAQNEIRA